MHHWFLLVLEENENFILNTFSKESARLTYRSSMLDFESVREEEKRLISWLETVVHSIPLDVPSGTGSPVLRLIQAQHTMTANNSILLPMVLCK